MALHPDDYDALDAADTHEAMTKSELIEALADRACRAAAGPLTGLPCATGPLTEIAAIRHDATTNRLFAT